MLSIEKKAEGTQLEIVLKGRLDTTTAPELEQAAKESLTDVKELKLDFKELEYVSSAGLRVLLATQKVMTKQGGTMVIRNVSPEVNDIFQVTGFADILTVE